MTVNTTVIEQLRARRFHVHVRIIFHNNNIGTVKDERFTRDGPVGIIFADRSYCIDGDDDDRQQTNRRTILWSADRVGKKKKKCTIRVLLVFRPKTTIHYSDHRTRVHTVLTCGRQTRGRPSRYTSKSYSI